MNKRDMIDSEEIQALFNDPPFIVAGTGVINSVIGWQPTYTLEQGISKTIDSFKEAI